MNVEDVRQYMLELPGTEEVCPFADENEIIIYKIGGKWFAAYIFGRPEFLAVKCDPVRAVLLREHYDAITPAWHFNKRHWNDLRFTQLPTEIVKREIRHSYLAVIKANVTPKALRDTLLRQAAETGVTDAAYPETL